MFNTILVPTDGSELAERAVQAALEFAKGNRSKVIGLAVAESYPFSAPGTSTFLPEPETYNKAMMEIARDNLNRVATLAAQAGVPFQPVAVFGFEPADEIARVANEQACDIIFIASHGRRGLDRMLLGSVTQKVLARSKVPVLVFR